VDPGVSENLFQGMELVGRFIVDGFDAGIDEDLDAVDARSMGHVDGRVFYVGAVLCRLCDGIDLSVDGAKAVLLHLAIGGLGFVDETSGSTWKRSNCPDNKKRAGKDPRPHFFLPCQAYIFACSKKAISKA